MLTWLATSCRRTADFTGAGRAARLLVLAALLALLTTASIAQAAPPIALSTGGTDLSDKRGLAGAALLSRSRSGADVAESPHAPASPAVGPALTIADQVRAVPNGRVPVTLTYAANGHDVSATTFSVDYDETWLDFDPTDSDGDGVPDAVIFDLPAGFGGQVTFDATDTDGELDFFIADLSFPLAALPDGDLVTLVLDVGGPAGETESAVNFSSSPAPSFGDTTGGSVAGTAQDGSVLIGCPVFVTPPVDGPDLADLVSHWPQSVGLGSPYDLDADGRNSVVDAMLLSRLWGSTCN